MHEWDDLINKRKLRVSGLNPNKPPTFHSQPAFTPRGAFSRLTGGGVRPAGQFGADNSLEYPHDIHVGDPSKNPGFYQRTKDYSRMSSMWRDQQNSLRQMVAQDPNVKLPAGFGGKQNPGFARDYIHRGPAYEGLKGHRPAEQYIVYTNDGPEMVGDIGQKSPFLNKLGNFVNGLLSFIPGLRDPQYRNQVRRLDEMQKDAIRTLKYHARGKLMNPSRVMSDDDKRVVNGFLEMYYVGEGLNVKEAKRAAVMMTQMQNKALPGEIDEHMNDAIAAGKTDTKEILNHIKEKVSVEDDLGDFDNLFEDPLTEEGENVPDGAKLSYMLPEVNHKSGGKSYKPEDCEFGNEFLAGQHLYSTIASGKNSGKKSKLNPSHYKALRNALEAGKRHLHENKESHLPGTLPANPDQSAFDFIVNNPAFNDALGSSKTRVMSSLKNLATDRAKEILNPMVGYLLGNPEHVNQVAQERNMNEYDPEQPYTYFTPPLAEIVAPKPADSINVNSDDELALSEVKPIDLAWSILKEV